MAPDEEPDSTQDAVDSIDRTRTSWKRLTIRVDIALSGDTDKTTLASNLESIIANSTLKESVSNIKVRSLALRDNQTLCATVSLDSSLKGPDLCKALLKNHGSFPYYYSSDFMGITPLHVDEDGADLDIIAVPGLGSHALGTWKSPTSDDVWLRDWLPGYIPRLRVLLYGYDTTLLDSQSKQSVQDMGGTLLEQIITFHSEDDTLRRPIIFIGHSLGGLLIKEALRRASQAGKSSTGSEKALISEACYGLVFFGVPNLGLRNDQLRTIGRGQPNESLIRDLLVDSDSEPTSFLRYFTERFAESCKGLYEVVSFYETKKSPTVKIGVDGKLEKNGPHCFLVTRESATSIGLVTLTEEVNIALNLDHSGLVKYASPIDEHYTIVKGKIARLAREATTRVARQLATQDQSLPDKETTQECQKSLAFIGMDFRQNDIANTQAGTFEWFPKHKTFLAWVHLQRGLLWIKGKPGAGKSTLMKFARRIILEKITYGTIVISFFVHGRGSELQKTPLGLFRSVLHQLLERFPAAVVDLVNLFTKKTETEGKHGEKWEWQEKQLQDYLRDALAKILIARPVVILVDALDECGQNPAVELIDYFNSLLEDLPSAQNRIQIIFSCRQYPILSADKALTIDLGDENYGDIKEYVWDRLSSDTYDDRIKELITHRASGVFLWACLVVKRVRLMTLNAESQSAIEAKISSIPDNLRDLYNELMQELMAKMPNQQQSLRLMQWVCFAQQPLTCEEIQWALAVEPDCKLISLCQIPASSDFIADDKLKDRISTLSCGLVEVPQRPCYSLSGRIVQFIHQSVEDFLLEVGFTALGAPSPVMPIAHYQLAKICLQYIRLVQQEPSIEYSVYSLKPGECPLLQYAVGWWTSHVEKGHSKKKSFREIAHLLRPETPLLGYWEKQRRRSRPDMQNTLIHVATEHGLTGLVQWMLQPRRRGRSSAQLLGEQNRYGRTALHIAADRGNDSIIELIIKTGNANINAGDNSGQTPLFYAVRNTRSQVCVNRLLRTANIDLDIRDNNGRTPLSHAAENGSQSAVQLLIETGRVLVDSKDNKGRTPLSYAAQHATKPVVELLLETGKVDINRNDNDGKTPVDYAMRRKDGDSVAVRELFEPSLFGGSG